VCLTPILKVREHTEEPCTEYEVDVYATEFATCMCGHGKKTHAEFKPSLTSAPSYTTRQPSKLAMVCLCIDVEDNIFFVDCLHLDIR
jgi:hypothetical protein